MLIFTSRSVARYAPAPGTVYLPPVMLSCEEFQDKSKQTGLYVSVEGLVVKAGIYHELLPNARAPKQLIVLHGKQEAVQVKIFALNNSARSQIEVGTCIRLTNVQRVLAGNTYEATFSDEISVTRRQASLAQIAIDPDWEFPETRVITFNEADNLAQRSVAAAPVIFNVQAKVVT